MFRKTIFTFLSQVTVIYYKLHIMTRFNFLLEIMRQILMRNGYVIRFVVITKRRFVASFFLWKATSLGKVVGNNFLERQLFKNVRRKVKWLSLQGRKQGIANFAPRLWGAWRYVLYQILKSLCICKKYKNQSSANNVSQLWTCMEFG